MCRVTYLPSSKKDQKSFTFQRDIHVEVGKILEEIFFKHFLQSFTTCELRRKEREIYKKLNTTITQN